MTGNSLLGVSGMSIGSNLVIFCDLHAKFAELAKLSKKCSGLFLTGFGCTLAAAVDAKGSATSHRLIDFDTRTSTKAAFRIFPAKDKLCPNEGCEICRFVSDARNLNRHFLNLEKSFVDSHLRDSAITRN